MTDQPDEGRELSDVRIALNHLRVVTSATLQAGATRQQVWDTVTEAVHFFGRDTRDLSDCPARYSWGARCDLPAGHEGEHWRQTSERWS